MNGAQNGAGQNQQFDPTVGVMRYDKNRDGKVTKQEMPVIYHSVIDRGDRNRDGALDRAEVLEMYNQIQRQRGQGGNGGASGAAGQPGQSGALPRRPKFDQ